MLSIFETKFVCLVGIMKECVKYQIVSFRLLRIASNKYCLYVWFAKSILDILMSASSAYSAEESIHRCGTSDCWLLVHLPLLCVFFVTFSCTYFALFDATWNQAYIITSR
jgi:hypothetical protein